VIDGLEADVVTLALAYDIDAIAEQGQAAAGRLAEAPAAQQHALHLDHRLPGAQGQSQGHQGLGRPGQARRLGDHANPKTSGGARWNYLAAWGYALKQPAAASEGEGVRRRSTSQRAGARFRRARLDRDLRRARRRRRAAGLGERGLLSLKEFGADKFDIVYPRDQHPGRAAGAVVDKTVDKRGTRAVAQAYLEYLYTPEGQEIAARNFYRPTDAAGGGESTRSSSRRLTLFTIDDTFGGWTKAQKTHFADGGVFDQIRIA
jgi:ABC-type sulfate transport system substrate-binding protein